MSRQPKTKTLTDVPGYEGQDITIRRLSYGERAELKGQTVKTEMVPDPNNPKKDTTKVSLDHERSMILWLTLGVQDAPFFNMADRTHREHVIKQLDADAGEYLLGAITALNGKTLSEDEEKNSDEQRPASPKTTTPTSS